MLQIKEVCRQLGLNPQTIYFYERIGLIPKLRRTTAGYRLFDEPNIERLSFILRAKNLGLSLDQIKQVLELQEGQSFPCREVYERLFDQFEQIEETIARLQDLKERLLPLIQDCRNNLSIRGRVDDCPFFKQVDHESAKNFHC